MPDFVAVAVVAALTLSPVPADRRATETTTATPSPGFSLYRDAASCETAVVRMLPRAGTYLVCIPVEPATVEGASLY